MSLKIFNPLKANIERFTEKDKKKKTQIKIKIFLKEILNLESTYKNVDLNNIKKNKILIFIPSMLSNNIGGAETNAIKLANYLYQEGFDVKICCKKNELKNKIKYKLFSKIKIIFLNHDKLYSQKRILKKLDANLMIGFGLRGFYEEITIISYYIKCRYIIQECTSPTNMIQNIKLNNKVEVERAKKIRNEVLHNSSGARILLKKYNLSVDNYKKLNISNFNNSIDIPKKSSSKINYKKIICINGLKNTNKGGLNLIEDFKIENLLGEYEIHFYGSNKLYNNMKNKFIINQGFEIKKNKIFADAFALIIPSIEEGLPNVIMEANSFGVPCIGFDDCEGVNNVIKNNINGFLTKRKLPNYRKILQNVKVNRDKLKTKSINYCKRNFSTENFNSNWLKLIKSSLISEKKINPHYLLNEYLSKI